MEMYFSEEFDRIVKYSRDEAMRTGYRAILPDHLLLGILRDAGNSAVTILSEAGICPGRLKKDIDAMLMRPEAISWAEYDNIVLSRDAQNTVNLALLESRTAGAFCAESVHLLAAICKSIGSSGRGLLMQKGIDCEYIRKRFKVSKAATDVIPAAENIASELEKELKKILKNNILTTKITS